MVGALRSAGTPSAQALTSLDRATLEAAKGSYEHGALPTRLERAQLLLQGTEAIHLPLSELPDELRSAARALMGDSDGITGRRLLGLLEATNVEPASLSALPALAEVLHERLAHEEMLKGRLALGPMTTKLSAGNAARWFAAATAEIRGENAAEPIDDAGAARLVKLTRQLMLTAGGDPLVARFFDFAVEDLYRAPGLTDDAIAELAEFRRLIQRSGPQERRAPTTELSKAAARIAERALLNDTQRAAIDAVDARNAPRVAAARATVLELIKPWGFGEADLDRTIDHLKHRAATTIQFYPDKEVPGGGSVTDRLLADPRVKNHFETGISNGEPRPRRGPTRIDWEREIFDGVYDTHPLIPEERPKYGGLSALNSPRGNGGDRYGPCFFVLRQDVKHRTTFTPFDSSGAVATDVTTHNSFEILLQQIHGKDPRYLRSIFQLARGEAVPPNTYYSESYIEAQLHGALDLARDVESIVVWTAYLKSPYGLKLAELAEQIGVPIKYTDQVAFHD